MYSIAFPNILNKTYVNLTSDHNATSGNLQLLVQSPKTSFFGDPAFGCNLQSLLFNQNSPVLDDLIIDDLYTNIKYFMPLVTVKRKDITINHDSPTSISASIKALNKLDNTVNLYTIALTENSNY